MDKTSSTLSFLTYKYKKNESKLGYHRKYLYICGLVKVKCITRYLNIGSQWVRGYLD